MRLRFFLNPWSILNVRACQFPSYLFEIQQCFLVVKLWVLGSSLNVRGKHVLFIFGISWVCETNGPVQEILHCKEWDKLPKWPSKKVKDIKVAGLEYDCFFDFHIWIHRKITPIWTWQSPGTSSEKKHGRIGLFVLAWSWKGPCISFKEWSSHLFGLALSGGWIEPWLSGFITAKKSSMKYSLGPPNPKPWKMMVLNPEQMGYYQ